MVLNDTINGIHFEILNVVVLIGPPPLILGLGNKIPIALKYDYLIRFIIEQKEFAAALFNWLKTLPKEQRENQAVVSRTMTDVLGGWAYIDRDKLAAA